MLNQLAGFRRLEMRRNLVAGLPAPVTDPNITAFNADGWSAQYTAPPTFDPVGNPKYAVASRQGYNASGGVTTHTDNLIITQRVRQPHPNHASLDANRVAATGYVLSTDTVTGVTNNSALTSPKAIANWGLPDRQIVGGTIHLEVVAFHILGVAAVEFRAFDGTTTVTATTSTMVVLTGAGSDQQPVLGYQVDLDVSSLANPATITVNAKVLPRIGAAASVHNSSDNSGTRGFTPRKYYRSTSLLAAPVFAYVASGGNDTTGVVSTTAAVASASPCLTIEGAVKRINAIMGTLNGAEVRIKAGTHTLSNTLGTNMPLSDGAQVLITRDPETTKAAAIVQLSTVIDWTVNIGTGGCGVRFKGLTFNRVAAGDLMGVIGSVVRVTFEDVAFDCGAINSIFIWDYCSVLYLGCTFTNGGSVGNFWSEPANAIRQVLGHRGCTGAVFNPPLWLMLGCSFSGMQDSNYNSKGQGGSICAFNKFPTASLVVAISATSQSNIAIIQNLIEITTASTQIAVQLIGITTLSHCLLWNNTCTGFNNFGRTNLFYDEAVAPCTSTFCSTHGNNWTQLNTKGDRFDLNGALVGNWAFLYGVECSGEFTRFIDAQGGGIGGSFAQAYPGLGASMGTSGTVANDPLFVNYQGVTSGPTNGAGGGNYNLQSGSTAKARVPARNLPYDLAGAARSATAASAGAYE